MPRRHHKSNDRIDVDEGNAIGLTRAFSPIEDDELISGEVSRDPFEPSGGASDTFENEDAYGSDGRNAGSEDDSCTFEDGRSPVLDDARCASKPAGRHARHAKPADEDVPVGEEDLADQEMPAEAASAEFAPDAAAPDAAASAAAHAAASAPAAPAEEVPEYLRKSRRMRRILIVVIVVLVLLLAAGGVLMWQLMEVSQRTASQQAQNVEQQVGSIDADKETKDASTATAKKTTVPDLVGVLGLTQEEAVEFLQHGAQVSSTREVNEEGNPIKLEVRVMLTSEPSDTRSGTPTVYLGFNEDGAVVQAGYSVATSSLGYGSLSFSDAVRNENIIEKTLDEAGVTIAEGTVELPEDKMEYSTYATDGTTLTKEYCSFSGEADIDGATHAWSAVLSYDYAMANATGNLADTIRTIYVYVNA